LTTAQESIGRYRELVARDRAAFLPNLAWALTHLANRFTASRRDDDGLAATQEAFDRYVDLNELYPFEREGVVAEVYYEHARLLRLNNRLDDAFPVAE